jgi:HlyD family secretion protein
VVAVGGVLLLATVFAVVGRSVGGSAGASGDDAPSPARKRGKTGGGGVSFSFGGGGEGQRVEVLTPRRGSVQAWIQAPGTVQAGSEVGIGAPFEGRVSALHKDDGDAVAEGEVVFELDARDKQEQVLEAEIDHTRKTSARFEAEVELKEAQRRREEADQEPSEVTEARLRAKQKVLSAEQADAQLAAADARLERAALLLNQGVGRESDVEAAETEQRVSAISLRIAKEELSLAEETLEFRRKTWDEGKAEATKALALAESVFRRAEADLKAGEVALSRAKRDLDRCKVRSPLTGLITARQVNHGDEVARATGDVAHYIISDLSRMLVYADVDEGDVVRVQRGQDARVVVNALPDGTQLTGKVYDVGYRARTAQGAEVSNFRVRILLEPGQEPLAVLRPGMSAAVEVQTADAQDALKVPIQAVVQRERSELPDDLEGAIPAALREQLPEGALTPKRGELLNVVFVVKDGKAQARVVHLGIQDEHEVQVLGGLEEDQPVAVGPFRTLDDLSHDAKVRSVDAPDDLLPPEEGEEADAGETPAAESG